MVEDGNVQTGNQIALNNSNSFYCICQQHLLGEETVICSNVNCIIKVFPECYILAREIILVLSGHVKIVCLMRKKQKGETTKKTKSQAL